MPCSSRWFGFVLEQYGSNEWQLISFTSIHLNEAEENYSPNELELLAVVWSTEQFRNYIYGRYFTEISYDEVLLALLNYRAKGIKQFSVD